MPRRRSSPRNGPRPFGVNLPIGCGVDVVELERFTRSMKRGGARFMRRIFTLHEEAYARARRRTTMLHLAGRFAAKEALAKALGTGFGPISWLDLEILNDTQGKPIVHCSTHLTSHYNNPQFLLSISHCHNYATAVAILM